MKEYLRFIIPLIIAFIILAPFFANIIKVIKKAENNYEQTENATINIIENKSFDIWQGKPKIWYCDRVLIITKKDYRPPENVLEEFFNPNGNLSKLGEKINPIPVEYSCRPDVSRCFYGGKVCFKHAVKGDGYIIEWGMYFCHNGTEIEMECKEPKYCLIYFTGVGCPHCALTDPFLFYGILEWNGKKYVFKEKENTIVVEYEIYKEGKYNAKVFDKYLEIFFKPEERWWYAGVPHIFINKNKVIVGDIPILEKLNKEIRFSTCSFIK